MRRYIVSSLAVVLFLAPLTAGRVVFGAGQAPINPPQFDLPAASLGTGTFGRVTGTAIDQRQIQLALKYTF